MQNIISTAADDESVETPIKPDRDSNDSSDHVWGLPLSDPLEQANESLLQHDFDKPVMEADSEQNSRGNRDPDCRGSGHNSPTPILFYVKALYDYTATGPDQFDFEAGDMIAVTNSSATDGWWYGRLLDEAKWVPGRDVFPSNTVKYQDGHYTWTTSLVYPPIEGGNDTNHW
ncbi:hypothetical protein D9611_007919 [Ephemerocybe angulata]|uniref:SH3 domain-containing protein n=1 Tax=Ephemerocybe angulata TaxID=980116 RepID=A0A8H5FKB9_9AGAR|nr:hypothetical protein D9611_007919 [Tulosesus angulatus]